MFSFLKELDNVGLKPNLRSQGNTLKARLEELIGLCGSGDSATALSVASVSEPIEEGKDCDGHKIMYDLLFLLCDPPCH